MWNTTSFFCAVSAWSWFAWGPHHGPHNFFFFCCSLQLENLGNFIKAILAYGLKPNDIFEANDLFENGNMTQVQTTLLALASTVSEHIFSCYKTQIQCPLSPLTSMSSLSGKDQRYGHQDWYWSEICRETSSTFWWWEDQGWSVCHWTAGNFAVMIKWFLRSNMSLSLVWYCVLFFCYAVL